MDDQKPVTRSETRLEEDFEKLKDSPEAQRFRGQGGLSEHEAKEADKFLKAINKVQAKRGDYEPEEKTEPKPEVKAPRGDTKPEESEQKTESNPEVEDHDLTDDDLKEVMEDLEGDETTDDEPEDEPESYSDVDPEDFDEDREMDDGYTAEDLEEIDELLR